MVGDMDAGSRFERQTSAAAEGMLAILPVHIP